MPEERSQRTDRIRIEGGGRGLALIPLAVAVLVGALMLPRGSPPEAIPMPAVDERVLSRVEARDRELTAQAQREPLSGVVRALGSAIREFNTKQAQDADELTLSVLRTSLNAALAPAVAEGMDKLVVLRAAQVEGFLAEVKKFEQTGKETEELQALGGGFVRRMRAAGWCGKDNRILLDDAERRIAFKAAWNGALGLETRNDLVLSLDEMRALYRLYLRLPHAPEGMREQIESARRSDPNARTCAELDARESYETETWRLEKIKKLGALDPAYPKEYAAGVAEFRRGQMAAASAAFRTWLAAHPDGPWSMRARNHLKLSLELAGY